MKLAGKLALVTGAVQGIGKEITLELSRHGSELVIANLNLESEKSSSISTFKLL